MRAGFRSDVKSNNQHRCLNREQDRGNSPSSPNFTSSKRLHQHHGQSTAGGNGQDTY